ncbi:MAG: RNA-binding S4 domain-containing protein [Pseudomonadota bacterium]
MNSRTPDPASLSDPAQRIDKWLWCARFFRTRNLAATFVSSGKVRIARNGATLRISKPGFLVRPGDRLTYGRRGDVVELEIIACGERRGTAAEARTLYSDLSPSENESGEDAAPIRREDDPS